MSLDAVQAWLRKHHRFGEIPEDQLDVLRPNRPDFNNTHAGHFLIDRTGIVRWVHIETPIDDLSRRPRLASPRHGRPRRSCTPCLRCGRTLVLGALTPLAGFDPSTTGRFCSVDPPSVRPRAQATRSIVTR
jgi:hypothetical protein